MEHGLAVTAVLVRVSRKRTNICEGSARGRERSRFRRSPLAKGPSEPERCARHLGGQGGVDEGGVVDVAAPPRRRELHPRPGAASMRCSATCRAASGRSGTVRPTERSGRRCRGGRGREAAGGGMIAPTIASVMSRLLISIQPSRQSKYPRRRLRRTGLARPGLGCRRRTGHRPAVRGDGARAVPGARPGPAARRPDRPIRAKQPAQAKGRHPDRVAALFSRSRSTGRG